MKVYPKRIKNTHTHTLDYSSAGVPTNSRLALSYHSISIQTGKNPGKVKLKKMMALL